MRELQVVALVLLTALAGCNRGPDGEDEAGAEEAALMEDAETTAELLSPVRSAALAVVETTEPHIGRSARQDIRQFAQTVAADHRALITVLDSVAMSRSAPLAETSTAREVANAVRMAHAGLESVPGGDIDMAFIRAQVESHRRLLDTVERDGAMARSTEMQTLTTDIRAMVQAHLTRARQLLGDLLGEPVEPPPTATQPPAGMQTPPSPQPPTPAAPPGPPDTIPGG
jgi:putative membrane protein